eukprot:CAMPEP_0202909952 /NCGR_PEP_ID=MMETSP1392-20130828/50712_1 /ASSEMBLY_ACC=CAM_ASM_000868 /TAXON_ID=225041 /ORGANISM="Chlamydomonas chlamydogama, Strain SAG 11-48b" /LENGTH=481 /DNA_ID=CAMNT_0049599885 /DNA_START=251 /DNA_END=1696 /DNA_ORIENTATION=+
MTAAQDLVNKKERGPKPDSGQRPPMPKWATTRPYTGFESSRSTYTSMTRPFHNYKIYKNIWYHNGRWYAVVPSGETESSHIEEGLSPNIAAVRLPITDPANFTANLRIGYVAGNSVLLDFPFPAFPDHLGHWLEMMVPTYNVLRDADWVKSVQGSSDYVDHVVLPNLNKFLNGYMTDTLISAFEPGLRPEKKYGGPSIIDYADLDGFDKLGWVLFENIVVMQDRYTHPERKNGFIGSDHGDLWRYDGCDRWVSPTFVPAFAQPSYGQDFRAHVYGRAKWELPSPWTQGTPPKLPRTLTLLMAPDDEPTIKNKYELSDMLRGLAKQFGLKFRISSLTNDVPLLPHLATMAESAVVVGRHHPAMAASVFMPPGSMLLDLLPYKWEWHNLSMLYFNITQSIGDVHHFAWRPTDHKFCVYKEQQDKRYKDWFPSECHARECLSVFAKADLLVDLEAVRSILLDKLPKVLAGHSVQSLREPWPEAV